MRRKVINSKFILKSTFPISSAPQRYSPLTFKKRTDHNPTKNLLNTRELNGLLHMFGHRRWRTNGRSREDILFLVFSFVPFFLVSCVYYRCALCSVATTIAACGMSTFSPAKSILFQRHAALLVTNNALCLMSGLVSGI